MSYETEHLRARLQLSIREMIAGGDLPQYTAHGVTQFLAVNGVGVSAQPAGNVQVGGENAHMTLDDTSGTTALTGETQVHGQMKLFPGRVQQLPELNMGMLNPQLVPPIDPTRAGRFAPPVALVGVRDINLAPQDTPVPAIPPYVVILPHTHPTPSGPSGPNAPIDSPVLGIELHYLYGHNRVMELLRANMSRIYTEVLP